jgi:dUTP pyrophosphatase
MNVKKLSDKAVIPSKGSVGAAGYDLYTTESYELKPGERKGFYGRVAPRSGLAVKHGIDVLAGVIDSDYRGEILVALINLGDKPVQLPIVKDGKETAIAQIIFEACGTITGGFVEVDDLTATQRGSGGFGSSDNKRETIDQASKQMSKMEELYNKLGGIPTPARKYSELINEREQQQFNK